LNEKSTRWPIGNLGEPENNAPPSERLCTLQTHSCPLVFRLAAIETA